jgi:hypothetical protein
LGVCDLVLVYIKRFKVHAMSLIAAVAIRIASHSEFACRHKAHAYTFGVKKLKWK